MQESVSAISEAFVACAMMDHGILIESTVTPEMMQGKSSVIYRAMKGILERGATPDFETLYMDGSMGEAKSLLMELQEKAFTSANWKHYEGQLIEAHTVRKLTTLGMMLSEGKGSSSELVNVIERTLLEVGNVTSKNEIKPIESNFQEWLERLKNRIAEKGCLPGFSWGLRTIDTCTLGACKNQLVVVGARPSEGKSAIAVQMMRHQAYTQGVKVGLITIESSNIEVTSRFISGGVPIDGMKTSLGFVTPMQLADIRLFLERAEDRKNMVYTYDRPGITIGELRSAARRMVLNYGVQVLYVDYLQLIHVPKSENKIAEVGYASVALKEIARELNICVVVLAQLKRDEKNARPTMGSIQWASAVEQTADAIWLLYHKKDDNGQITESKIILEKVRDGRTQDVKVRFDKQIVTFFELEEQE
jgi:replicative DNA helicase